MAAELEERKKLQQLNDYYCSLQNWSENNDAAIDLESIKQIVLSSSNVRFLFGQIKEDWSKRRARDYYRLALVFRGHEVEEGEETRARKVFLVRVASR